MKHTKETGNNMGQLAPPPKQFAAVKRVRQTPYNPFKTKSKTANQSTRWNTFKNCFGI
jgi:hypothetical protein